MKTKKNLTIALVLVTFVLTFSTLAAAGGSSADDKAKIAEKAVDFLDKEQVAREGLAMWRWAEFSDDAISLARDNYGGIIGLSLVRAYQETGNLKPLSIAKSHADKFVSLYREKGVEEVNLSRPGIVFLAEIYNVTGDKRYYELAKVLIDRFITERGGARGMLESYYRYNINLSSYSGYDYLAKTGYDVAWDIRALLVTGNRDLAEELALLAVEEMVLWMPLRAERVPYGILSAGALAAALIALERGGDFRADMRPLLEILLNSQGENGSWANNDSQVTAYALLGLKALKSKAEVGEAEGAISGGELWLKNTELESGAWGSYNDGIPELAGEIFPTVHSEALLALLGY